MCKFMYVGDIKLISENFLRNESLFRSLSIKIAINSRL